MNDQYCTMLTLLIDQHCMINAYITDWSTLYNAHIVNWSTLYDSYIIDWSTGGVVVVGTDEEETVAEDSWTNSSETLWVSALSLMEKSTGWSSNKSMELAQKSVDSDKN